MTQKPFTPLAAPTPQQPYQTPAPQPASFVPEQQRFDAFEVTYGVSKWNPPPWLAPPVGAPEVECDHCGDPIAQGQTAVELFCGVVGRSWKTGHAMIVTDVKAHQELHPVILHLECIELYARFEIFGGYGPEDEEIFCASCANRIEEDYEEEG
jgi:hypothetical protein